MAANGEDSARHVNKKPRLSRESFNGIVQVKVGPKKTLFNIHKTLLCRAAPYFRAALEGSFLEGKTQVLELPEDNVPTFQRFQLWLYSDNIVEEGEAIRNVAWKRLADLYIFGEMRSIPALQNAVIDTSIDKQFRDKAVPVHLTPQVYTMMSDNNALRRLLLDWAANLVAADTRLQMLSEPFLPHAFLVDLAVAQYQLKRKTKECIDDFRDVRSSYHVNVPVENTTPQTS